VPGKGDVLELEPDLLADDLATGRRGVESDPADKPGSRTRSRGSGRSFDAVVVPLPARQATKGAEAFLL
jgi:hypothetical protein